MRRQRHVSSAATLMVSLVTLSASCSRPKVIDDARLRAADRDTAKKPQSH